MGQRKIERTNKNLYLFGKVATILLQFLHTHFTLILYTERGESFVERTHYPRQESTMNNQLSSQDEFFIYVPHSVESLNVEPDFEQENTLNHSAHEAWVKIPLAQCVVVYAHVCGEEEQELLIS
jgi:hypothetical protein